MCHNSSRLYYRNTKQSQVLYDIVVKNKTVNKHRDLKGIVHLCSRQTESSNSC